MRDEVQNKVFIFYFISIGTFTKAALKSLDESGSRNISQEFEVGYRGWKLSEQIKRAELV